MSSRNEVVFFWHFYGGRILWCCYDFCEHSRGLTDKSEDDKKVNFRLFKKVEGELPPEVVSAGEAYIKAQKKYINVDRTNDQHDRVWRDYLDALYHFNDALDSHKEEIEFLHKKECVGCPWVGHAM